MTGKQEKLVEHLLGNNCELDKEVVSLLIKNMTTDDILLALEKALNIREKIESTSLGRELN